MVEGFDEGFRGDRVDGIAVTAQSSHSGFGAMGEREANGGIGVVGVTPSRLCVACQN